MIGSHALLVLQFCVCWTVNVYALVDQERVVNGQTLTEMLTAGHANQAGFDPWHLLY